MTQVQSLVRTGKKKRNHCTNQHAGLPPNSRVRWPNQNSPKAMSPPAFPSQQMIPHLCGSLSYNLCLISSDLLLSFISSPPPSNLSASLISPTPPKMGGRCIVPSSLSKPPSLLHGTPPSTSSSQVPLLLPLLPLESGHHAAKSFQSCLILCDPIDSSPPGSPSLGFSRQEHWIGLPLELLKTLQRFPIPFKFHTQSQSILQ